MPGIGRRLPSFEPEQTAEQRRQQQECYDKNQEVYQKMFEVLLSSGRRWLRGGRKSAVAEYPLKDEPKHVQQKAWVETYFQGEVVLRTRTIEKHDETVVDLGTTRDMIWTDNGDLSGRFADRRNLTFEQYMSIMVQTDETLDMIAEENREVASASLLGRLSLRNISW